MHDFTSSGRGPRRALVRADGSGGLAFAAVRRALSGGASVMDLVVENLRRARAVAGDGVFVTLADEATVVAEAKRVERRLALGEAQPLAGLAFTVKDCVHVAGLPTTSNCAAIRILPDESATAVARLEAKGAIVIGKATLDQFATGLNGTRGPEPVCRNAIDPDYISGGSSSGSAVAVARGVVPFSIGTDTGGSGRVPAACNGIVGLKPTVGLLSSRGLIYNSRLFDTLSVFALNTADAYEILGVMAGHDPLDPFSREDADAIRLRDPAGALPRRLATPRADQLRFFGDDLAESAFDSDCAALRAAGFTLDEVDFAPFEEAGRLVFGSAFVAERLVEYGGVLEARPDAVHPAVRAAIEPGLSFSAKQAFEAIYELAALKLRARRAMEGFDALVVPTVPTIFTIDEMLAEPVTRNARMGLYTYFANPLDLCAVSVPGGGRRDGLPSSLCFLGGAGADGLIRALAEVFEACRQGPLSETFTRRENEHAVAGLSA